MNALEHKMVETLIDLKENYHVIGIKAEFEAEGTRMEEALRLKEVVTKAGLDLTIKIGGGEAIKDMYDARSIGVKRIVAPMIETPYALKKFLHATRLVFPDEEWNDVDFLVNIETIDGYRNFDRMLELPCIGDLKGIVLGRVDMTGSMGMTREDINSEEIFKIADDLCKRAEKAGLECVIGGGVSAASIPFFNRLPQGTLHGYETRKVIFACPEALGKESDKGILKAVGFELMWLKNKRHFYRSIYEEDANRIVMLEARYKKLIEEAGGNY
ncbi:HpcH/HpaI aldolase/citrate lyase family protein [Gabonibacter chumensis]|uniref:HpcH/HpaI aldolase/citrate lyase family protein n=1 Tax=Gabonibacter chumensis TaxID=2972474 RepID=UPI0025722456|nr:HpcH/HpaI aldolase/citrate lyase family protein [Gabonibacter chumensis]MCR9011314.1 HpcH/HpaI aldolase/citrate lyase family protein [Gabonibacter chumensis]